MKRSDINTWEELMFFETTAPAMKRRLTSDGLVLEIEGTKGFENLSLN